MRRPESSRSVGVRLPQNSKSGVVFGFALTKFGKIDVSVADSAELHTLATAHSRMTRQFDRVHASLHSDIPHRRAA